MYSYYSANSVPQLSSSISKMLVPKTRDMGAAVAGLLTEKTKRNVTEIRHSRTGTSGAINIDSKKSKFQAHTEQVTYKACTKLYRRKRCRSYEPLGIDATNPAWEETMAARTHDCVIWSRTYRYSRDLVLEQYGTMEPAEPSTESLPADDTSPRHHCSLVYLVYNNWFHVCVCDHANGHAGQITIYS